MINSQLLTFVFCTVLCGLTASAVVAQSESDLLQQLQADYAMLLDAMEDYEYVLRNQQLSEDEKLDYSIWIRQLQEQFTETCHVLSQHPALEADAGAPCSEYASAFVPPADIDIEREYTEQEKTAAISERFNNSLGEFDEKLLREQDRVKASRPQNSSGQGGSGAGSGQGQGQGQGQNEGEDGSQTAQESSGQPGQSGQTGANQDNTGTRGRTQQGNRNNTPDDIPDGSDDDVVARQLREAAEKETDPELREKLWDEYRRYKRGQ